MELHAEIVKEVDGRYSIRCVEFPSAVSWGYSEEEALNNVREAIDLVLEQLGKRVVSDEASTVKLVV